MFPLSGLEKSRRCVVFKCYSDAEFHDTSLRVEEPERQSYKEVLESLEAGDLVAITLSSSERLYFEITKKKRSGAVETLCEGEKVLLSVVNASTAEGVHELSPESKGFWPPLSDAWLRSYPGLKVALQELRKSQKQSEGLPSQKLLRHSICSCQKIGSLAQLERDVMNNPGFWCDGTGPEDKPLTPDETALLSAGEIVSLLHEYRGIVLIQLRFSVMESDLVLPLLRPYVLQLLRESCRNKSMAALQSTAADGKVQSLILHSKRQPFKAWSRHLAEIGVQASLVADSPYYKMLIGRMLGYKESNIVHHIEVSCGTGIIAPPYIYSTINLCWNCSIHILVDNVALSRLMYSLLAARSIGGYSRQLMKSLRN